MVAQLDIATEPHPMGLGDVVPTTPMGATNVPGVYAAGNLTDPSNQVLQAAARGAMVGAFVNMDLVEEEAAAAVRSRADAQRWDERYGDAADRMWSGAVNGTLAVELEPTAPGRILDVGCGEGADAIWLAERGWEVTAVDISTLAIERARAAGADVGVTVDWQCADVLTTPPPPARYDVVTIQYPALLRDAGEAALRRLLAAVRPVARCWWSATSSTRNTPAGTVTTSPSSSTSTTCAGCWSTNSRSRSTRCASGPTRRPAPTTPTMPCSAPFAHDDRAVGGRSAGSVEQRVEHTEPRRPSIKRPR
jgi:hypothetical protein